MYTDVLDLVAPSPSFRSTSYLAPKVPGATNPNITYVSPYDDDGNLQLVYCKGFVTKSGKILGDPTQTTSSDPVIGLGPWDWMTVTQEWIRQRMTERIWTNLATGKLECVSGLGIRRLPRRASYSAGSSSFFSFSWVMTRPETDYLIFDPPTNPTISTFPTITKNTDSIVRCTFSGPYSGAAIDDLPAGEDWREDYEWGGSIIASGFTFLTKEVVWHRRGYGRYMWQAYAGDGKGGYASSPSSQSQQTIIKSLPPGLMPIQNVF